MAILPDQAIELAVHLAIGLSGVGPFIYGYGDNLPS
jgi:hypothetical protein